MKNSTQHRALKAHWGLHKVTMTTDILQTANSIVKGPYGWVRGEICMNDELWDWVPIDSPYQGVISNEGNMDDECQLLSDIWVYILSATGDAKYLPIIHHLADVEINGL